MREPSKPPAAHTEAVNQTKQTVGSQEMELKFDRWMENILAKLFRPTHTIIIGERRSEVLGERFTTREYLTPGGKIVEVKTIMEMEFE